MGKSIQIAFQVSAEDLDEIDRLVPVEFPSRAAALRNAVEEWLRRRREVAIDLALASGYDAKPTGGEENAWAEASLEGLRGAKLDW